MTSPSPHSTPPSPKNRFPIVLITNLCVGLLLLAALPVIHNGQRGFVPHAVVDNDYVSSAISSGEADYMNKALHTTEIARAMAHQSHVATMGIMQLAVSTLAVLFFLNSLFLFRIHRLPQPQPVRITPGS